MDFTLMMPREAYSDEESAADDPHPHSLWCRGCDTEWLTWEDQDQDDPEACPECERPPTWLMQAIAEGRQRRARTTCQRMREEGMP